MPRVRSSTTLRGTESPRLYFVRRGGLCFPCPHSRTLGSSSDHGFAHHQSTGSHVASRRIPTPLGAHVRIDRIVSASSKRSSSDRRQSQLASQGPVALAEALTESLRKTGDLDLIEVDMQTYVP